MQKRWDIFCKVVDNFGDIGVCWRLARQLQAEHGLQVRLWVDDLEAAQSIIPSLNIVENSQICDAVTILKWNAAADFSQAATVVIEAFACELPPAYLAAMARQQSKWVNLEYLSAENWVDDFHAKPSPQGLLNKNNGLTRYFYFPGFTEATGGLIREANILVRHSDESRNPAALKSLDSDFRRNDESSLKISLFCYPQAPIHALFDALAESTQVVNCYVPASSSIPQIADYFGVETIDVGDYFTRENLHVHILPFLSQADYDELLRDCDLNFVRGEDSWLRAIWAGKPFIWQPYIQDENAHIKKLEAFLNLFYAQCDKKKSACEAHRYWSAGQLPEAILAAYLNDLKGIHTHTQLQSAALAKQKDLAAKLVDFCNKL
jgi:uncharacterized repeat protein (TIGR03837 family)